MMEDFYDNKYQIKFKTGYCNLAEFAKMRQMDSKKSKFYYSYFKNNAILLNQIGKWYGINMN